jgi:hypothetical protein
MFFSIKNYKTDYIQLISVFYKNFKHRSKMNISKRGILKTFTMIQQNSSSWVEELWKFAVFTHLFTQVFVEIFSPASLPIPSPTLSARFHLQPQAIVSFAVYINGIACKEITPRWARLWMIFIAFLRVPATKKPEAI